MSFNNKSLTNKVVCTLIFTKKSRDEFVCSTCMKTCKNAHKAAKDRNALRLGVIDEETRTIFRWCKWVVVDRLPLSFVERKMTRKNASLPTISEKTLKLYLMRIFESAEGRVAEELPLSFGIVLDGCTFNGRHFITIFAVFNDPGMCSGR
ncbi:hypothetical protein C6341_g27351 [Phytophthora cactorum]|nr:hypothetical protein C6341_g27351 [Phytophthora cactorum]